MAIPFYYNPATNELELTADPSPLRTSVGERFGLNEISTRAKTLSPTKSYTKDPYPWDKPEKPWWEEEHEPAPWDAKDGGRIDMKPGGIVEPGVTHYATKKSFIRNPEGINQWIMRTAEEIQAIIDDPKYAGWTKKDFRNNNILTRKETERPELKFQHYGKKKDLSKVRKAQTKRTDWIKEWSNYTTEQKLAAMRKSGLELSHLGGKADLVTLNNLAYLPKYTNKLSYHRFEKILNGIQADQNKILADTTMSVADQRAALAELAKADRTLRNRFKGLGFDKIKSRIKTREFVWGMGKKEVIRDPSITIGEGRAGSNIPLKTASKAEKAKIVGLGKEKIFKLLQQVQKIPKGSGRLKIISTLIQAGVGLHLLNKYGISSAEAAEAQTLEPGDETQEASVMGDVAKGTGAIALGTAIVHPKETGELAKKVLTKAGKILAKPIALSALPFWKAKQVIGETIKSVKEKKLPDYKLTDPNTWMHAAFWNWAVKEWGFDKTVKKFGESFWKLSKKDQLRTSRNLIARGFLSPKALQVIGSRIAWPVAGAMSVYDAYKDYQRRKPFIEEQKELIEQGVVKEEEFDKEEPMFAQGGIASLIK